MLVPPLRLVPMRSPLLTFLLVSVHVLASLYLLPLSLIAPIKVLMIALIGISLIRCGALHAWRTSGRAIREIVLDPGGRAWWTTQDGWSGEGVLRADTYVHPQLVVLRVAASGRRCQSIVLLRTMLDHDSFRRLRVLLRRIDPSP